MKNLYIGLMSGTSVDGIDAAIVDFSEPQPRLIAEHYTPYSASLRQRILELCQPGENEINRLGELDSVLGKEFACAVQHLLADNQIKAHEIGAIGSHGQTIRHHPQKKFTLQIGDPNVIAAETGITTVADFRRRDVALGGEGAPLVPAFHQAIFSHPTEDRVILNIGGIANITFLPANPARPILGFDTGPGNTLLDAWVQQHLQQPQDEKGNWASQGQLQKNLLDTLLQDRFFHLPPPKSTGREYFNLTWLTAHLSSEIQARDVQATLIELTVQSILRAIAPFFAKGEILVCGGGVHNAFLMKRLREEGKNYQIETTQKYGVPPDTVEAMAFAWLAKQTLLGQPGNLIAVTGAKKASILGGVYYSLS